MSVRLKLTLSYAGFLMVAGALLIAAVWVFLLRDLPDVVGTTPVGILDFRYMIRHEYAPATAVVMIFLLVFGLLGGWALAGRMLAPLDRLTEATRIAANGSLSHRIRLPGRGDEFHELADSFDAMLGRLERHDTEQRRFAANASHELRTPLAITQALLDVARHDPGRVQDGLDERLRAVNTRAIELTEALLLLSRAEQGTFAREDVDLSLIAEEVTETLLPLAVKHDVTIETTGDVTRTVGSPTLLTQLTTNLLHNAIVHNLPRDGVVRVDTVSDSGSALLTVESSGEPLSPALVSTLAEPFQRGTERIRHDQAGVGLGLAIAKSITQAHDGTLTLAARPEGGLCVRVSLPAAAPLSGLRRQGEREYRRSARQP